jgi:DNA-binding transcriptional MerR regulator
MLIGELAAALGVPTQTIRFYERRGLLPEPARGSNGYRVYDDSTLARVQFIRSAQAAGLTLAEISGVLTIRGEDAAPCTHVTELLTAKLADVQARRRRLDELETEIERLLERSDDLDPSDCSDGDICHILDSSPRRP